MVGVNTCDDHCCRLPTAVAAMTTPTSISAHPTLLFLFVFGSFVALCGLSLFDASSNNLQLKVGDQPILFEALCCFCRLVLCRLVVIAAFATQLLRLDPILFVRHCHPNLPHTYFLHHSAQSVCCRNQHRPKHFSTPTIVTTALTRCVVGNPALAAAFATHRPMPNSSISQAHHH
eukprot:m.70317 g.70317  ORF g.70317 m.70317 type:complete len:175 (+) comp14060_c0_seq2:86-610(+)